MAKFNLTPSAFDKLKGDVITVKKSELEKLAEFCKENIKRKEELEAENQELREKIEKLEKKLNKKALDMEVGRDSECAKLARENKQLKEELESLHRKYEAMEKMYLEKIAELSSGGSANAIAEVIKKAIREEFKKLEQVPETCTFEINV